MKKVTFVIPSKGRATLANTIASLYDQTAENWNAIIAFDAVEPTLTRKRKLYPIASQNKLGVGVNGAGAVRNFALDNAEFLMGLEYDALGDWVGLVDDDDILLPTYVYDLDYISRTQPMVDMVIFGMQYQDGSTLPPPLETNVNNLENKVGISFAFKKEIFFGSTGRTPIRFEPSSGEDFQFIKKVKDAAYNILVAPMTVNYLVAPLGVAPDRRK